jgi:EAL domain-containing protein (putative c-di-GMP-specific phosphodiesterase class I)
VEHVLDVTGLPPERLRMEVTERVLVEDVRSEASTLIAMRTLGVRLAGDDFGASASSLGHLREINADMLRRYRRCSRRLPDALRQRRIL